ncbi:molybdopterin-dependent oxidoreductase [Ramlibacter sp. RBP-2]|uniref:Molybdopterin-dependent oxidoreductase n=1 Tax=Ramlibacter lithotrophicus TaxID=2606681 RepID=A0A7X6DD40_9BURK|nr:molybdopterin cofactor-binding domain-containing protein [Ramlibacter lithotrophicus]NKE64818.1 molybdopterin-dependent oxidoreductase [Ramlibacter lithotrophicus]
MTLPPVPENLKKHPRLGQWLDVGQDGRIRAYSGKVDIGQGISHALRLVVAEELQLAPEQVHMVKPTTVASPDEAVTSGSLSIQHSGASLRYAAAHLREACRARYARKIGVAPQAVALENGTFFVEGKCPAVYSGLVDADMLAATVDPQHLQARGGRPSALGALGRTDIELKVFGEFEYIQDLELPGMCHGAVFRPKALQAQVDEAAWATLQPQLAAIEGVIEVVRDGMLVGVLAEAEHVLAQAGKKVEKANLWSPAPSAAGSGWGHLSQPRQIAGWLRAQALDTTVILDQQPSGPPARAARVFRADYGRAWLQHGSIGLCCAIAQWNGTQLQVWSHTQGIFNLRRDLALAFGVPADAVTVCHADGAGCYGHNGADDVAFDAAWLARHAGARPLRLQWTRQQEMANSPLAPAMTVGVEAAVDDGGNLVSWKQEVWSQGHGTRPGRGKTPALLGAWQTAQPAPVTLAVNQPPNTGGGSDRNSVPPYAIARVEVLNHRVLAMPLRVSAMRALGAHVNVLAAESTMDEIARSLGRDPLEYRLAHLQDERAKAVLREAARLADWPTRPEGEEGFGRGIGFARYKNTGAWCAVVADLVMEEEVRLKKLYIAADLGLVVHPDGARNQIEGGAVQAASWTLREASDVAPDGIRSDDWESYPIFSFADVPEVEVSLIDRPDMPSLGAGECSAGPTAAAIANAVHDALGVRMRFMPFTADALMDAAQND